MLLNEERLDAMNPAKISVLLIDRDAYIRETFRLVLDYHAIPHYICQDADSALAYLGDHAVALVIIEYKLATAHNDRLLSDLRALAPDAKFIVTSARQPSEWAETTERHGFDGFIPKLFDVSDLVPYLGLVVDSDRSEDFTDFWNSKR